MNIPIYRAKKIDSDEYVMGMLTKRVFTEYLLIRDDINTNLINTFRYKEDVADFLKCAITTVRSAINGTMKTCKGYIIKQVI